MLDFKNGNRRKWMFAIATVCLFVMSTIIRLFKGLEVDDNLSYVFTACFAIVFGANAIEFFKR